MDHFTYLGLNQSMKGSHVGSLVEKCLFGGSSTTQNLKKTKPNNFIFKTGHKSKRLEKSGLKVQCVGFRGRNGK